MKKGVIAIFLLFFLILIGIAFSQNNNSNNKVDKKVKELLEQQDKVSVIVVLEDDYDALNDYSNYALNEMDDFEKKKMMIGKQQERVLSSLKLKNEISISSEDDFELKSKFTSVNGFSGKITKKGLEKLKNNPNIKKIYPNRPIKAFLSDSKNIVNASRTWSLIYSGTNVTGKDQVVCIIDSGVDYTHSDLGNCVQTNNINDGSCSKVIGGYDFVNNDQDPIDDNGHGTHVAGIVASTNITQRGIAPDANIVSIKVTTSLGTGNFDDITSGINWCVDNSSIFNITIISMSVGSIALFTGKCDDSFTATAAAIDNAIAKNISVVAAAGNDGSTTQMVSPACIKNTTAVGWTNKDDTINSDSNRNSITDLLAPGSSITSLNRGGGFLNQSGTSMSTPMVAGAFALVRQYKRLESNIILTPAEIEDSLNDTGKQISDSGLTFSRINIFAAILSLDTIAPNITFASSTLANKSNSTNAEFFINITSNEVLVNATLEFNGTNETMQGSGLNWFKNKTLDSGVYLYKVWGNDSAGNIGLSELRLIQINNTAPNITSFFPSILVFSITEPNNQTFNITQNDLDGDIVTISWFKNSTLVSTSNEFNFTGNFTAAGFYNITVIVSDIGDSSRLTWNFTVNNTNRIPTIDSVILISTDFLNRTNGTLQGLFTTSDPENDIIASNETFWYKDGVEDTLLRNLTIISSQNTTKNQKWIFSVRVFDGKNFSNFANSTNLTIMNSNPVLNSIPDITVNESDLVDINISGNVAATDNDDDILVFNFSSPLNSSGKFQTSFTDARNYTVTVNVSDGDNGFDVQKVIIEVLDKVNGVNDTITGNITDIKTNVQNLQLKINGTNFNLDNITLGLNQVNFSDSGETIAIFDFNFSNSSKFNFIDIRINRTITNGAESLVINGIDLTSQNQVKTLFLNRTNATFNSVCVKDLEINSIDEISSDCSSSDETKLACDGIATNGFVCSLTGTTYKITGLSHSGIKQISFTRPSDSSGGSSGGGGGGGGSSGSSGSSGGGSGIFYVCNQDWSCGEWSVCEGIWQTRECDFVKVPQHTQSEICPTIDKFPQMAKKCETVQKIASKATEQVKDQTEKAEENIPSLPTGAAIAVEDKPNNLVLGTSIVFIIIIVGILGYILIFSSEETKAKIKKIIKREKEEK